MTEITKVYFVLIFKSNLSILVKAVLYFQPYVKNKHIRLIFPLMLQIFSKLS